MSGPYQLLYFMTPISTNIKIMTYIFEFYAYAMIAFYLLWYKFTIFSTILYSDENIVITQRKVLSSLCLGDNTI